MKAALIYWILGCLVTGAAVATRDNRCPKDPEIPMSEIMATAATWPLAFSYVWVINSRSPSACKVLP